VQIEEIEEKIKTGKRQNTRKILFLKKIKL
jgi:hypothetical protein